MAEKLNEVEERLVYLYWLKKDMIPKQREYRERYTGARLLPKSTIKSDYKTNTEFAIIQAKTAELMAWMQDYDFIPLSDEAYVNQKLIKNIWKYEWIKSKTDKNLFKAFMSWFKYWDWYLYEWIRKIYKTVNVPTYNEEWNITFKKERVLDYEGIYMEYIPWENVYLDWDTLDDANEVIWIKYWNREAFIKTFENADWYFSVNNDIKKWRYYYLSNDTLNITGNQDDDNIITELRYYNKAEDKFIILANWTTVKDSFIPYKHKELPFVNYVDYFVEWRVYNMWEYELLEEDVLYKDALRSLQIDVIKNQFWFITVDPDAEYDQWTIKTGINVVNRISPKDIAHFSPNISSSSVLAAEQQADNDIIIKSWIDFRSQVLTAGETATKTESKQQSSRKRINLNLKQNAYNFFERLARLRMSNIQLLYSSWNKKIPIKWWTINENGVFKTISWYWTFIVKPEYVKWIFNIVPITDSILWVSTDKDKNKFLEFAQTLWNIVWKDWKQIINPEKIVEIWAKLFWYNFDELTEKEEWYMNATDILDNIDKEDDWISTSPSDVNSPDYIPPEQRSWNTKAIPTIWWLTQ